MTTPTERFSGRADNYDRYRPGYPPAVVDFCRDEFGLTPSSHVADIGSGTGKLAEPFLEAGYRVACIEPNRDMREAAERSLAVRFPGFTSVDGTAEATTLADASADLVVAGQAFHWFDEARAREEFRRILVPGARVSLVWNERRPVGSDELAAYEQFLRDTCPDYVTARHTRIDAASLASFFAGPVGEVAFENAQRLDLAGLRGRLLSCSYVPKEGPGLERVEEALPRFFEAHASDGAFTLAYQTKVYYGCV